jgi:hypothetical protein
VAVTGQSVVRRQRADPVAADTRRSSSVDDMSATKRSWSEPSVTSALHIRRKAKHWVTGRFMVGGVIVGDEHSVILVGARRPAGLAYGGVVEVFGEGQLAGILSAGRARATSPFIGWAPRALWLEPEVTVEVRYLAQGPGLRHAVLVPPARPGRSAHRSRSGC